MKLKNVLFDVDGTLLDATEGIVESVLYTEKMLGLKHISQDTLLKFVGPPIQDSFQNYYGLTGTLAQEASDVYREYYKNVAIFKAKPYDGILMTCQGLKESGFNIGIATLKREDYAIKLLQHFGFDQYVCTIHGADNYNKMTKTDIFQLCINDIGDVKDSFVAVGDTAYDAIGAEQLGISFLGVTYGFGFKKGETIPFPSIGIADSQMDILNMIKDYNA